MSDTSLADVVIRTDADLGALWARLMGRGGFGRRSLWHLFLRSDGTLNPVIMPIDDVPARCDEATLATLSDCIRAATQDADTQTVAVLLSRPGPAGMTADDRSWARGIRAHYAARWCPWPVYLATANRVRPFAADDLLTS